MQRDTRRPLVRRAKGAEEWAAMEKKSTQRRQSAGQRQGTGIETTAHVGKRSIRGTT